MKISNRLFCYPVLAGGAQDYRQSSFAVDASFALSGLDWLDLSFDLNLRCPELETLIRDGKAAYAIHLECAETSFRVLRESDDPHFEERISRQQVRGALERTALVVLKQDVPQYRSADLDPDYDGITFDLCRGSILAYATLPVLDIEPLLYAEGHAVFTVFKMLKKGVQPMSVNLDEQHIMIGLGETEFDTYARYARQPHLQPLLNAALVFPALVYALEQLKYQEGIDDYADLSWFRTLSRAYAQQGSSLEEEIASQKSSIELAQELMELPVTAALLSITFAEEHEEEEQ